MVMRTFYLLKIERWEESCVHQRECCGEEPLYFLHRNFAAGARSVRTVSRVPCTTSSRLDPSARAVLPSHFCRTVTVLLTHITQQHYLRIPRCKVKKMEVNNWNCVGASLQTCRPAERCDDLAVRCRSQATQRVNRPAATVIKLFNMFWSEQDCFHLASWLNIK